MIEELFGNLIDGLCHLFIALVFACIVLFVLLVASLAYGPARDARSPGPGMPIPPAASP